MQGFNVRRECSVRNSARVAQIQSMFDVQPSPTLVREWTVSLSLPQDWNVGLIVGPSGCGKSTIAKEFFSENLINGYTWSKDKALIDDFPKTMSIKDISLLLSSVGFSSAPNWLKPFHVLSNGEQFRATCARAIAESSELIVIDEFTSVVDRQVAKIASNSIQKAIRRLNKRFVAVSCHYDIIEWLQPDWVYQPETDNFSGRRLRRRPSIDISIHSIDKTAWRMFSQYHYMSTDLNTAAQCFGAFVEDRCVGFIAYLHSPHSRSKRNKRIHRFVVHPDWQGVGIGKALLEWMGKYLSEQGFTVFLTTASISASTLCAKSLRWKLVRSGLNSKGSKNSKLAKNNILSSQRHSNGFKYVPSKV